MRAAYLLAVAALLAALCPAIATAQGNPDAKDPPPGPQSYHGVRVAGPNPKTPPSSAPAPYAGPRLALQAVYVGRGAGEPMIAIDPRGTAYFTAMSFDGLVPVVGHTTLLRSKDGGLTWQTTQPPFFGTADRPNDLDPYVYAEPRSGRVFDISLLGAGSYLSWSDDQGQTWRSSTLTSPGVNDHQTLMAAEPPVAAPQIRPTTQAFSKILYYCVNQGSDARCVRSIDGGESFFPSGGPAYLGVDAASGFCSALTGHLEGDSQGRIYLPSGHCGLPDLAVSDDGGATWRASRVSSAIGSADTHTAIAVDRADNLYYVWFDPLHRLPYLATSADHGSTWSAPLMVAPPGVSEVNFPEIVAGEPGKIALTFPGALSSNQDDQERAWNTYVVLSTNALDANPLFVSDIANPASDPIHRGTCGPGRCAGMFDFMDIQVSPFDGSVWATATDTCTDQQDCRRRDGTGNDAVDAQGIAIRQLGGPWLVGTAPTTAARPRLRGSPPRGLRAPSASRVKLTCRRSRRARSKVVDCRATLANAPSKIRVTLRLLRGKVVLGTGTAKMLKGRSRVRVVTKRRLRAGRYTMLVSVSRRGYITTRHTRRVRVR